MFCTAHEKVYQEAGLTTDHLPPVLGSPAGIPWKPILLLGAPFTFPTRLASTSLHTQVPGPSHRLQKNIFHKEAMALPLQGNELP